MRYVLIFLLLTSCGGSQPATQSTCERQHLSAELRCIAATEDPCHAACDRFFADCLDVSRAATTDDHEYFVLGSKCADISTACQTKCGVAQ